MRQLAELAGVRAVPAMSYDWPTVEDSIGLRLPEDYKLLTALLPPGWFRRFARLLQRGQSGQDPDDWPVIAATEEYDHWDRFDGTACEFLTEVAAGRYDASRFTEGPIRQVMDATEVHITAQPIDLAKRGPVFQADPPRPVPRPPSGTRPDFSLRRVLDLGSDRTPASEFAALAELAGPPPPGVVPVDWAAVHARLGSTLPSDYRAFADRYGAGTFGDVKIAVPGAGGDLDLFALIERKAAQIRGLPRHEWSAPLYPELGGAICWGETTDGYTCGWAPVGILGQ